MQKLLIATLNRGKLSDYKEFLKDSNYEPMSLTDAGIIQDFEEVFETFEENAHGKAEFYESISGFPTLADDSGVEIPYFNMAPGVNTKRWDGIGKNDENYIKFIVDKISQIPQNKRQAQLRAVLALKIENDVHLAEGKIKGILTDKVYTGSDTHGYPWDRIFIIPELNKYYEELTPQENLKYNHRRLALEKLKPFLNSLTQ